MHRMIWLERGSRLEQEEGWIRIQNMIMLMHNSRGRQADAAYLEDALNLLRMQEGASPL